MDYTAIIASIVTGVLGLGGIALFIKKNLPTAIAWVTVITKAFAIIDDLLEAIEPDPTTGKIEFTQDEIESIKKDALTLKITWAKLQGK